MVDEVPFVVDNAGFLCCGNTMISREAASALSLLIKDLDAIKINCMPKMLVNALKTLKGVPASELSVEAVWPICQLYFTETNFLQQQFDPTMQLFNETRFAIILKSFHQAHLLSDQHAYHRFMRIVTHDDLGSVATCLHYLEKHHLTEGSYRDSNLNTILYHQNIKELGAVIRTLCHNLSYRDVKLFTKDGQSHFNFISQPSTISPRELAQTFVRLKRAFLLESSKRSENLTAVLRYPSPKIVATLVYQYCLHTNVLSRKNYRDAQDCFNQILDKGDVYFSAELASFWQQFPEGAYSKRFCLAVIRIGKLSLPGVNMSGPLSTLLAEHLRDYTARINQPQIPENRQPRPFYFRKVILEEITQYLLNFQKQQGTLNLQRLINEIKQEGLPHIWSIIEKTILNRLQNNYGIYSSHKELVNELLSRKIDCEVLQIIDNLSTILREECSRAQRQTSHAHTGSSLNFLRGGGTMLAEVGSATLLEGAGELIGGVIGALGSMALG